MTRRLLHHPWILPLAFALLLGAVGWSAHRALLGQMRAEVRSSLETVLAGNVAALDIWASSLEAVGKAETEGPLFRRLVADLVEVARRAEDPGAALRASEAYGGLQGRFERVMAANGYESYALVDWSGRVLVASRREPGSRPTAIRDSAVWEVVESGRFIQPPAQVSDIGRRIFWTAFGIPDAAGEPSAALIFGIDPEREFERVLGAGRLRTSGETYAFDEGGVMLSRSRFEDQLREIGLLPAASPAGTNPLHVQIRDPGVDLTRETPAELPPLAARPLTRMAAAATAGETGSDIEGYRDYRGVPVVGAWTWIPELQIGLATELDRDEAFAGLHAAERRLGLVLALLGLASLGMLGYSLLARRLSERVDEVRRLGRYEVERKIGSGGMGTVYLAHHAMMRRPTAVKVLRRESTSREAIARFEREVLVSSQLQHPNTIEIYDFGTTSAGVFYYAMEYLEGFTIGEIVEAEGPLPEGRVIRLLSQAAGSIAEAHRKGIVHRDLKPSNLMVSVQGGEFDHLKVLDFGLVKDLSTAGDVALTDVASLTGTPLYMSPEMIEAPDRVDQRADIYQLGAIAFYMLTGRHVFTGDSTVEVLAQHLNREPEKPSALTGHPITSAFEALVLQCLAKEPAKRPDDGGAFLEALLACDVPNRWTRSDAATWWEGWRDTHPQGEIHESGDSSAPSGWSVDVRGRQG